MNIACLDSGRERFSFHTCSFIPARLAPVYPRIFDYFARFVQDIEGRVLNLLEILQILIIWHKFSTITSFAEMAI
jgi:hypothetical protein